MFLLFTIIWAIKKEWDFVSKENFLLFTISCNSFWAEISSYQLLFAKNLHMGVTNIILPQQARCLKTFIKLPYEFYHLSLIAFFFIFSVLPSLKAAQSSLYCMLFLGFHASSNTKSSFSPHVRRAMLGTNLCRWWFCHVLEITTNILQMNSVLFGCM